MTKKLPFFLIVSIFISFVFFQYSKSYDDKTTHPGLTDEMVDFYNSSFPDKLSAEEKEWIVQGSIDEDTPPRWINHFYDPTNGDGWKAENLGNVSPITLKIFSNIFLNTNTRIVSSREWLHNESLQLRYQAYGGNNTWENAIRQYIKGDKKKAYYILGHVLHLLEDKTVPDHTRNDTHAHELEALSKDGGSPYEDYSSYYTRQNLTTARDLENENKQPVMFGSIDDYLDNLANYSNRRFFSEHTINSTRYSEPKITKEDMSYLYGEDQAGVEFPLARKYEIWNKERKTYQKIYTLWDKSNTNLVLSSYFLRLTQEAVMNGAGVIKLFHEEARKAAQNPGAIPPEPRVAWWEKMQSPLYGALASYNNAKTTTISMYDFAASLATNAISFFGNFSNFLPAQLAGLINTNAQPQGQGVTQPLPEPALQPVIVQPQPEIVPADPTAYEVPIVPVVNALNTQDIPQDIAQDMPTAPSVVPPVEAVEIPAIASEMPVVIVIATTTAPVYYGSSSVTGVSPDAVAVLPPAEEPPISFSETSTTTDATATSTDSTATSTEPVIVAEPEIIDGAPIVINEIAWMGTKAQANDEWIELYNKTNSDIDLSDWTLESRNKGFSVSLSKTISAHGYFLLERTASTTTDQIENMVYSSHKGVLVDSGPEANLYLKNGTTTIDAVDFGYWLFGKREERRTMERVSPYATSTNSYNWKTYSETLTPPFAKDAKGDDIFGTPGRKNSVTGYYTPAGNIIEDTVWRKAYSPYYVPPFMMEIKNGTTLIIEPSVVVKFAKGMPYGGGMNVRGVLRAEGTASEPIAFTSFLDDAADGIDSNQDGSASVPASADWMNVNFYGTTTPSVISHAQVKYGGQGMSNNPNGWYPKYTGVFSVYGASPQISDLIFEKNHAIAVYVEKGAHPTLEHNTIKNTIFPAQASAGMSGFGVRIADASSTADIIENVFEDNIIGISSESATSTPLIVKDNIFTRNGKNGEFNGWSDFNVDNANNQDSERTGGFYIKIVVRDGQVKTLRADTMPYILRGGITVEEGGVLAIDPGAVIKSAANPQAPPVPVVVRGTLKAQGTADKPIVFTAFEDDSDGYDSDGGGRVLLSSAWENIQFIGATSSDSVLEYVNIRYGGSGTNLCPFAYFGGPCMEYKGAVRIQDASPTISHAMFDKNLAIAAYVEGDAQPIIEYSDIRDTKQAIKNPRETTGGIGISIGAESAPALMDNTFTNNLEDVVYRP